MMERRTDESYLSYVDRLSQYLADGLITYEHWSDKILGEILYSEETMRRCHVFFTKFLEKLDEEEIKELNNDKRVEEIRKAQEELLKERKKIQTANLEYQRAFRETARFEMFNERIEECINNLQPFEFTRVFEPTTPELQTGVLCIADAHYGVEIELKTLFGEVVNAYNPDILKGRLNKLLNDIEADKDTYVEYGKLIVFDLGDAIQNMLRMSDLVKLRVGVLESTLEYAEMISTWLVEVSERLQVPVEYVCLGGNHAELRLLEAKRNFEEENLGRVIRAFVALRLKDNPNITVDEYSEFGYRNIQGLNVLAMHGDYSKDDGQEVSFWENYHNITIDIFIMGHFHHSSQKTIGYALAGDKEVVRCPSLVGIDTYSKRIRKIARAGAKFLLFEDGMKSWEKVYILN